MADQTQACRKCGQAIKATDWTCPHCGHTRWGLIAAMWLLSLLFLAGAFLLLPGRSDLACIRWVVLFVGLSGLPPAVLATAQALRKRH
jgi:hypothetical protein